MVRPIYKAGDRNKLSNYRLISLNRSVVGRLSEAALAARLTRVLYSKGKLFSEDQHGFPRGDAARTPKLYSQKQSRPEAREGWKHTWRS